jgi:hypothetical protein
VTIEGSGSDRVARNLLQVVEALMMHPQTHRLPRLVPLASPRLDLPDLWRRHRAVMLARLVPAFGIVLLLSGLSWAVGEYAHDKAALRQAETNRYLAEFRALAVGDAWQQLSAAWQAGQDRQSTLLARLDAGNEFDSALRNYRHFVLETVEERQLPPHIATVRQFFERLAVCIRVGNCDRAVAAAHLRPALRRFRDQHYFYFEAEGTAAEFDRVVAQITADEPWLQKGSAAQ